MKRNIIIALVLALILGTAAFADTTTTTDEATAADVVASEPAGETEADAAAPAEEEHGDLDDALKALHDARLSTKLEELEKELTEYVEAGKITQEQADLIMNSIRERQAAQNGECPNCGYKFQNNGPRMGQFPGMQGGNMMHGRQQNGRMPQMGGQMPQMGGRMPGNH